MNVCMKGCWMDERMNESSSAMANGGGSPACLLGARSHAQISSSRSGSTLVGFQIVPKTSSSNDVVLLRSFRIIFCDFGG